MAPAGAIRAPTGTCSSFCSWAGQFESYLVQISKDKFFLWHGLILQENSQLSWRLHTTDCLATLAWARKSDIGQKLETF